MTWFLLALGGHLANAAAFLVDKMLLTKAFKRSATYAVLMGSLSALAVLAAPWVNAWPDQRLFLPIFAFGSCFVAALWAFFSALRREEASRVVPIVGALVPIFTWIGESFFLGGVFSARELFGFAFLVLSTVLFTRGSKQHKAVSWEVLELSVLAAFLFATASLSGKFAFDHAPFLGVLVISRIFGAITAFGIALVAGAEARAEIQAIFLPAKAKKKKTTISIGATMFAVIGQLLGGIGFICVHLAMIQGSAAMVNALQAVQYGVLVLLAWIGGTRIRALLKEEISLPTLVQKGIGVLTVGIGLWLLTHAGV